MKPLFKKVQVNFFNVILVVAALAFAFRLANIATFSDKDSKDIGVIMSAGAIEEDEAPITESDAEPPTMDTQEQVQMAQAQTEQKTNQQIEQQETQPRLPALPADRTFSDAEIEILQSLSKRRAELDKRERRISEQQALLDAAEQEVSRKIDELKRLRTEIETLLDKQTKEQENRINSLVKIYEGMKPKEAATIFNTLDMDVLIAVISRMKERKSSPILADMHPEKARTVTIKLMEQKKLPGLPEEGTLNE